MMILVLLAGLVLLRESRRPPLDVWDNRWADFLAMNSRQGEPSAPVALVEINDASLQGHAWPWNPLDFSLFVQGVLPHQPEVVAIHDVLDWNRMALPEDQQRKLPQYEKILKDNLLRVPKLLLGAQLGFPEDPQLSPKWQEVPLLRKVKGDPEQLPEFPIVEREPSEDYRLTATIGFTNLPAVHERFNSVPLLFRHHGQIIPSFTLQAVMLWAKLTPDDVQVLLGSHITLGEKLRIPIDLRGRMRVDFATRRSGLGFDELLLANEQLQSGSAPVVDLAKLKGSIVLLARTDSVVQTIPFAARRNGSPGELLAAAIATIQSRSFIRPAPQWAAWLVLGALVLLSARVPRLKKSTAAVVGFVTLAVYVMIAMTVFGRWLVWLPGVMPAGVVLIFVLLRLVTPETVNKPKKPVIF